MESNSYDEMPYASLPFAQTHPDRLATTALLYGLNVPALAGSRVLELGCAAGGNLIPLMEQIPNVELVGVDASSRQIGDGQRSCDALGFTRVRLVAAGIETIDASYGEFDFIVCHGVYSWVPPPIQAAVLEVCRARLKPDGIAYVSYNTLPGWRMRGTIRDLMRHHALNFSTPSQQVEQARAMLDFLAQAAQVADPAYNTLLRQEVEHLRRAPDHYIYHEHLEAVNEPIYFREFVERAAQHGLQFLAESEFGGMLGHDLPDDVAATVEQLAPSLIEQQQLLDFVRNRSFRQSLLVHAGRPIERRLDLTRIDDLHIASRLVALDDGDRFGVHDGPTVSSTSALSRAALQVLAAHWPAPIAWTTLLREAGQRLGHLPDAAAIQTLRVDLIRCYGVHLLDLHTGPGVCATRLAERPLASALARHQARASTTVTTLRHAHFTLDEPARSLLGLLDGIHTRDEAVRRWRAVWTGCSDTTGAQLLEGFLRAGLLRDAGI